MRDTCWGKAGRELDDEQSRRLFLALGLVDEDEEGAEAEAEGTRRAAPRRWRWDQGEEVFL